MHICTQFTPASPAHLTQCNVSIYRTAQVPYYNAWVNALRTGLYTVHAWVSLILVVLVYRVPSRIVSVHLCVCLYCVVCLRSFVDLCTPTATCMCTPFKDSLHTYVCHACICIHLHTQVDGFSTHALVHDISDPVLSQQLTDVSACVAVGVLFLLLHAYVECYKTAH